MLGAAVVALFKSTGFMDKVALMDYGWRYPFIASAGLGVAGYFLTAKAEESPHFKKGISSGNLTGLHEQARSSLPAPSIGQLLQEQGRRIMAVTGVSVLASAAFYTYYIFLPAFQSTMVQPTPHWNASSVTTFMLFISVLLMPLVGRSADTMGPGGAEWWMMRGAITLGVASPFLFIGLSSGNYFMSFGAHVLATIALCAYTGPLAAWLVKVRSHAPAHAFPSLSLSLSLSPAAPPSSLFISARLTTPTVHRQKTGVRPLLAWRCAWTRLEHLGGRRRWDHPRARNLPGREDGLEHCTRPLRHGRGFYQHLLPVAFRPYSGEMQKP